MHITRLLQGIGLSVLLAGCGVASSTSPRASLPSSTLSSTSSSTQPSDLSSTAPSTSSANSPSTPASETVSLPVSVLTPTFGGGQVAFHYPTSLTVTVPVEWASRLQAIGTVGFVVIVPKGWTGTALEGADGSRSIALYPSGGSSTHGPRLTILTASQCVGCAWSEAAPYFAWVRQHYASAGWGTYSGPTVSGYAASPDLRYYESSTPSGLRANGVAFAPFVLNAQSRVLFRQSQIVLAPGEHGLATLILNNLLGQLTSGAR